MSFRNLEFAHYNKRVLPEKDEIFASNTYLFQGLPLELYVIGTSHQLVLGDVYSERLACDTNQPLLRDVQHYAIETKLGVFCTAIWCDSYTPSLFESMERSFLKDNWNLLYCFEEQSAITAIKAHGSEISTLHTYIEDHAIVFSRTRLL